MPWYEAACACMKKTEESEQKGKSTLFSSAAIEDQFVTRAEVTRFWVSLASLAGEMFTCCSFEVQLASWRGKVQLQGEALASIVRTLQPFAWRS